MLKSTLQIIYTCCVQKTARKKTKYSRKKTILKMGHHAKAIAHPKSSLWVKNLKWQKICQNLFYKSFTAVLCKKTARKKTKYSKNETILKISLQAQAI